MNEARFGLLVTLMLCAESGTALAQKATPPAPLQPASVPKSPATAEADKTAAERTAERNANARRLDEKTAVMLALRQNPGRRAAQLDLEGAKAEVFGEEGRYPYIFRADGGFTRTKSPALLAGDGITSSTSRSYTLGTELRRTFPTGTAAKLRIEGERFERDTTARLSPTGAILQAGTPNSGYGVTGRAEVVQPLMRGAGTGVGELELRVARVSRTAAQKTLDRVTSELVRDVLSAYWELWFADESLRIEQAALELARQQEREAQARAKQGAIAPSDVLSFSTRVAQLEESLVGAEIQKRQRSLDISRLMSSSEDMSEDFVASTEPPPAGRMGSRADVEAALRADSVELAELQAQVNVARARAEYAGESGRPLLNVEGFVESQGLSERVPRAFERAGQMAWITAHIGLVFELPLDDSRREADKTIAVLNVRSAEQNLKGTRDRISSDVMLALANESAAIRRLALAERTLELAEKTHEAEKARYELGQSIPITVQQAEDEVRRARLRVARARVDLAQTQLVVLHLSGKLRQRYASS